MPYNYGYDLEYANVIDPVYAAPMYDDFIYKKKKNRMEKKT